MNNNSLWFYEYFGAFIMEINQERDINIIMKGMIIMLVDTAIRNFTEKYNAEAMQSIDNISKEFGLNIHNYTIKVFNINEAFESFNSFLRGYCQYRISYNESTEASSVETVQNDLGNNLSKFFEDRDIRYRELPKFVSSYVEGVDSLIKTVNQVKSDLMENDIGYEYVAAVNELTDTFFAKLQESFDSSMDRILWASGYNAHQRLAKRDYKVSSRPIFL